MDIEFPNIKAIVRVRWYDSTKGGRLYTRTVTHVTKMSVAEEPPRFHSNDPAWAELFAWTLFRGNVLVNNRDLFVWGWSFISGKPPLFWAHDEREYRHKDLSAWAWLNGVTASPA